MKLADHIARMQALLALHPDAEIMKIDYAHGIVELEAEVEVGYRLAHGDNRYRFLVFIWFLAA